MHTEATKFNGEYIWSEEQLNNILKKENTDWSKIPIDTKVVVTSGLNPTMKYNKYFAGLNAYGKPMVFCHGKTSWTATSDKERETWNNIELYEEEELLNTDVVCIKSGYGFNLATTYTVKNGIIKGCDYKFKNLEELNSYFVAKFAESVIPAGLREEKDIVNKYSGYASTAGKSDYEKHLSKEQPLKYNDTVICVKRPIRLKRYLTEGKIYEIKNGEITLDTGIFLNIKDLNKGIKDAEFSTVINKSFVCIRIPLNLEKHFTIGKTYEVKDGMISSDLRQCGIIVSDIKEFSKCFKDVESYKVEESLQSNIDFISKEKIFWDGNKSPCNFVATKYKLSLLNNQDRMSIRLEESDGICIGMNVFYKKNTRQECMDLINKKFLNKYDLELVLEKKYKLYCKKNLSEEEITKLEEMSIQVEEVK